MDILSPQTYKLPHSSFRPHQHESILWADDIKLDHLGNPIPKITEQSTGSGKSDIAIATSINREQTVILTESRNLQHQYSNIFTDAISLFGRANYPCIHDRAKRGATAEDCLYGNSMRACGYFYSCPYAKKKEAALHNNRTILNYAYWLTTYPQWCPEYLVLDEAHNLSNIVLEHVGMTVGEHDCKRWGLPVLPIIDPPLRGMIIKAGCTANEAIGLIYDWLDKSTRRLGALIEYSIATGNLLIEDSKSLCKLHQKLASTLRAVEIAIGTNDVDHWYIRSGKEYDSYHSKQELTLVCKPLTARYDFKRLFTKEQRALLLMSATIGNMKTFAKELGIKEYDGRVVPNQWKPEERLIYALPVPSMGHGQIAKNPKLFDEQARVIAEAILAQPHEWSGLILVTRKTEAKLLADRLSKYGDLADRLFIMPGYDGEHTPTEQQVKLLAERVRRVPNTICTTWSLWQGYDGVDQKICIVAKVPFPYIADDFEKERMKYDGNMFLQRTAWQLEQGLGRTRRGNPSDYDVDGQKNGFVAIADGSWTRVKKYLSESTREAIVDYLGG